MTDYPESVAALLECYVDLLRFAQAKGAKPPVVFAGVGVYLLCRQEHFRPGSGAPPTDLDLLIDAADLDLWQHLPDCEFLFEDNLRIAGWIAKTCFGGAQADLIASARFYFPELSPHYVFALDASPETSQRQNWRGHDLRILPSAQQLAFKLLMWRGQEQSKFDREDARALILDTGVEPEAVHQALFHGRAEPAVLQTIRERLHSLAGSEQQPRIQRFCQYF